MRSREQIIRDFNANNGKYAYEALPFILEVLLDIRELLEDKSK